MLGGYVGIEVLLTFPPSFKSLRKRQLFSVSIGDRYGLVFSRFHVWFLSFVIDVSSSIFTVDVAIIFGVELKNFF